MPLDWSSLAVGPQAVAAATLIALALGVWLGWLLENREFAGRGVVSALATFALILPAPLTCYYLMAELGHQFALTPLGLVLAGILSAMPFLLRRARLCFAALPPAYGKAARSLGAGEWRVFAWVELPQVWKPLLRGAGLAFVRLMLELTAASWIADTRV